MFNGGIRGKRAKDGEGTISSQSSFIQTTNPVPTITGYSISGVDDLAANTSGGQTIVVSGTGFAAGMSATLDGVLISPVTIVSSTQLTFTAPVKSAGSYPLTVYASGGSAAVLVPGITFSGIPQFANASGTSVGSYYETKPISSDVKATSDSTITYSIVSGSLPTGATLNSNGTITGTSPATTGADTYTFQVKATDAELQDTTVTYTITVNTDAVNWTSPANNAVLSVGASAYTNTFVATSAAGYGVSFTANVLPVGISLASNGAVSGTATVAGNTSTLLTATAATTGRTSTRTITWSVVLGDVMANFSGVTALSRGSVSTSSIPYGVYPRTIGWSIDGTKFYFYDYTSFKGYVQTVSSPFAVPSSSFTSTTDPFGDSAASVSASFYDRGNFMLRIVPNGASGLRFEKWSTASPYSWSGLTLVQTSSSITTNYGGSYSWYPTMSTNGLYISFVSNANDGGVWVYKMTTAYDLSTLSYHGFLAVANPADGVYSSGGLLPNGTGAWVHQQVAGAFTFKRLTTPWNLGTAGSALQITGFPTSSQYYSQGAFAADGSKAITMQQGGTNSSELKYATTTFTGIVPA